MPNWCSNTIEIQGTKEQVNKFVSFLDEQSGKEWFDFFHPCPQELKDVGDVSLTAPVNEELFEKYGASDWYTWSANNWGTKWNCDAQDWIKVESPNGDEASVSFWFDSPWGPPIALYQFRSCAPNLIVPAPGMKTVITGFLKDNGYVVKPLGSMLKISTKRQSRNIYSCSRRH